jgi:hypothetical protein
MTSNPRAGLKDDGSVAIAVSTVGGYHSNMQSFEELTVEALRLPTDQRFGLARKLLQSVEAEPEQECEAAWDEEIRERIARYRAPARFKPFPGSRYPLS